MKHLFKATIVPSRQFWCISRHQNQNSRHPLLSSLSVLSSTIFTAYVRLDCAVERHALQGNTQNTATTHVTLLTTLHAMSNRSTQRFLVHRLKQVAEGERVSLSLDCLLRRVVGVMQERGRALDRPKGAMSEDHFYAVCAESEQCTSFFTLFPNSTEYSLFPLSPYTADASYDYLVYCVLLF